MDNLLTFNFRITLPSGSDIRDALLSGEDHKVDEHFIMRSVPTVGDAVIEFSSHLRGSRLKPLLQQLCRLARMNMHRGVLCFPIVPVSGILSGVVMWDSFRESFAILNPEVLTEVIERAAPLNYEKGKLFSMHALDD